MTARETEPSPFLRTVDDPDVRVRDARAERDRLLDLAERVLSIGRARGYAPKEARELSRIKGALDGCRRRAQVETCDVGTHPDLVDRDGDRWYEIGPDAYRMEIPHRQGTVESDDGGSATYALLELNSGPLFPVPRRIDRGPIRDGSS